MFMSSTSNSVNVAVLLIPSIIAVLSSPNTDPSKSPSTLPTTFPIRSDSSVDKDKLVTVAPLKSTVPENDAPKELSIVPYIVPVVPSINKVESNAR